MHGIARGLMTALALTATPAVTSKFAADAYISLMHFKFHVYFIRRFRLDIESSRERKKRGLIYRMLL